MSSNSTTATASSIDAMGPPPPSVQSSDAIGRGGRRETAFRVREEEVARLHTAVASITAQLEEHSRNVEQLPAYGQ